MKQRHRRPRATCWDAVSGIRGDGEGYDLPDLTLPWGQDAVIEAVAEANPNTIVVLKTGGASGPVGDSRERDGVWLFIIQHALTS